MFPSLQTNNYSNWAVGWKRGSLPRIAHRRYSVSHGSPFGCFRTAAFGIKVFFWRVALGFLLRCKFVFSDWKKRIETARKISTRRFGTLKVTFREVRLVKLHLIRCIWEKRKKEKGSRKKRSWSGFKIRLSSRRSLKESPVLVGPIRPSPSCGWFFGLYSMSSRRLMNVHFNHLKVWWCLVCRYRKRSYLTPR